MVSSKIRLILNKISNRPKMRKIVNQVYRPFDVKNISGGLVAGHRWTTRRSNPPVIEVDFEGRTTVTTQDGQPTYLVAQGYDRDFQTLAQSSGNSTGGQSVIRVDARLEARNGARVKLLILEFDRDRKRIGELTLEPVTSVLASLLPATEFILPAIRVAGEGQLVVSSLSIDSSNEKLSNTSNRIELARKLDPEMSDDSIEGVRAGIRALQGQLAQVGAQLQNYSPGEAAEKGGRGLNSRDDGPISQSREALARELLIEMANQVPNSNGSHHFQKIPATVGIVADESMFNFYKDVFQEVVYINPGNHLETLGKHQFDAFIYVTCWKGLSGEEWKGVKFREKPKAALSSILAHASRENIPTIFQSIEDPSNFEYFLPVAERFDWVFTSDEEMIPKYVEALDHSRVFYGEYGANPMINNPVGSFRTEINRAFFAGSYPERYPERCADMRMIFDSIPDSKNKLTILDRNFGTSDFKFPEKYEPSVMGPVPHDALQKMHKLFRYSLNFNSIKSSPTMCAMRVYELQAQGKPLISNYARSVFNRFPGIRIVAHPTSLEELLAPARFYEELYAANIQMTEVLSEKTSFDVVSTMMSRVGLPEAPSRNSDVLIVAIGNLERVREQVQRQRLVNTVVVGQDDLRQGSVDVSSFGYLTAWDDRLDYEPYYLASRLNGFKYTDSRFITQRACFKGVDYVEGLAHEYVEIADERTVTVVSSDFQGATEFILGDTVEVRGAGYAADPFGIGYMKFLSSNLNSELLKAPKLSVVIPIYNNAKFLLSKCLPSLRRNQLWSEMEVLLIDDGSTEMETIESCQSLAHYFENVRYYGFGDGGSGTASRPRNKGVELATASVVTFLDPDNEISPGGYDFLLDEYDRLNSVGKTTDFVSGYQVKVGEDLKLTGKHSSDGTRLVTSAKRDFFAAGRFPVVSTQAAVLRKSFLQDNSIRFVENAAGQDTLYGWEVLAKAQNPAFTDGAFLLYFAERSDSVTNSIGADYFSRCLALEEVQMPTLKNLGLLDFYKDFHFDNFMSGWYLKRLEDVKVSDREAAISLLRDISRLYGKKLEDFRG